MVSTLELPTHFDKIQLTSIRAFVHMRFFGELLSRILTGHPHVLSNMEVGVALLKQMHVLAHNI